MQIFIAKGKQQTGPFSEEQIHGMVASGMVLPTDPAWHEGLSGWLPLSQVLDLPSGNTQSMPPPFSDQPGPAHSATNSGAMFLYIPIGRLIGLSIASYGLYQAYWIYRNWRYLKERDGLNIMPFWRGIFGVFFISSLLTRIKTDGTASAIRPASFSPLGLAIGWIILIVLGNFLGPLGILLHVAAVFCLLPVQKYNNDLNESLPSRPSYYGWSKGHIVCLVFGIICWVLVIVGLTA